MLLKVGSKNKTLKRISGITLAFKVVWRMFLVYIIIFSEQDCLAFPMKSIETDRQVDFRKLFFVMLASAAFQVWISILLLPFILILGIIYLCYGSYVYNSTLAKNVAFLNSEATKTFDLAPIEV